MKKTENAHGMHLALSVLKLVFVTYGMFDGFTLMFKTKFDAHYFGVKTNHWGIK